MNPRVKRTVRRLVMALLALAIAALACVLALYVAIGFEPRDRGALVRGGLLDWMLRLAAVIAVLLLVLRFAVRAEAGPRMRGGAVRAVGKLSWALFLLLLLEGFFRLAFLFPPIAERMLANESYSWRRLWVSRHRGQPALLDSFDRYDPTKGWITKPDLRDVRLPGDKILNTNSTGQRGTRDFAFEKTPGVPRIVVLGDSFTFGEEASDDETYCALLARARPQIDVINLGVHGYAHDQMLIHLRETGVRFHPDVVLLGFVQVDMDRNLLDFRDFAKPRFECEYGRLRLEGSPVPTPEEVLAGDWMRPRLLDVAAVAWARLGTRMGWDAEREESITACILDEIVRTIEGAGAIPVLAYLPIGSEIANRNSVSRGRAFFERYCARNPQANGFSTAPHFWRSLDAHPRLKLTGHWDIHGHEAAAAAIQEFLTTRGFLGR